MAADAFIATRTSSPFFRCSFFYMEKKSSKNEREKWQSRAEGGWVEKKSLPPRGGSRVRSSTFIPNKFVNCVIIATSDHLLPRSSHAHPRAQRRLFLRVEISHLPDRNAFHLFGRCSATGNSFFVFRNKNTFDRRSPFSRAPPESDTTSSKQLTASREVKTY